MKTLGRIIKRQPIPALRSDASGGKPRLALLATIALVLVACDADSDERDVVPSPAIQGYPSEVAEE